MRSLKLALPLFLVMFLSSAAQPQGGERWAVIIGVNHYLDNPAIPNLNYCVQDAELLADTLAEAPNGFPRQKIRLLTDGADNPKLLPTLTNIVAEIPNWLRLAEEGDTVLVYFSGHGIEDEGRTYLLPSDARMANLALSAVSLSFLREKLSDCKASQKFLILDACHSAGGRAGARMREKTVSAIEDIATSAGMVMLASCDVDQQSYEWPEKGHGVFTYFLVEALEGKADRDGNGELWASEVNDYVYRSTRKWAADNGLVQEPVKIDRSRGELILAGVRKPGTEGDVTDTGVSTTKSLAPGLVRVLCDVDGAQVLLDGAVIGLVGSGHFEAEVPEATRPNKHVVRVEMEGYAPWQSDSFTCPPDGGVYMVAFLRKLEAVLEVTSEPPGAVIKVNGWDWGKTPMIRSLSSATIAPKEYAITLELPGYKTWVSQPILMKLGDRKAVAATLQKAGAGESPGLGFGFLFVQSDPEEMDVVVDGRLAGKTPLTLTSVSPGEHVVELCSPFHETSSQVVQIKERQITKLEQTMRTASGSVAVSTDVEGARILWDGQLACTGPGERRLSNMRAGEHEVTVEVPLGKVVKKVLLKRGETLTLDLSRSQTLGSIAVLTGAGRDGLHLDGVTIAGSAPLVIEDVPAGEHELYFEPGQIQKDKIIFDGAKVSVTAGEIVVVESLGRLERQREPEFKIAFTSDREASRDIYIIDSDGTNERRLTKAETGSKTCWCPSWSPDGKKIAFRKGTAGYGVICVADVDGGDERQVTDGWSDCAPSWSPDGSKIAFSRGWDQADIYVIDSDGTNEVKLTEVRGQDDDPTWSPDGKRIAFASYRDGNWEVYVMNADGTNQTRLTNNPAEDWYPSWSPDGSKIAFTSDRDGNREIYVINADGTSPLNVTKQEENDSEPAWSPDGRKIAFQSNRDGNAEIYAMNADGTGQTRLTHNEVHDLSPCWSPF